MNLHVVLNARRNEMGIFDGCDSFSMSFEHFAMLILFFEQGNALSIIPNFGAHFFFKKLRVS